MTAAGMLFYVPHFLFCRKRRNMSYNFRPLEELKVIDDFLMNAIANDPDVGEPFCRILLSVLLQRPIGKLKVRAQRVIPALTPEHRGIRMDVEMEEELQNLDDLPSMNLYDVEPHLPKDLDYPRHNRFYQAKIDNRLMKRGEKDFRKLPNLFVITITNYDIYGYDYMMYTVHNKCDEVPELEYKDGVWYFYFNTSGTKGGSPEIKAMLNYIQNSTDENVTNDATRKLHQYVKDVKILPEVRREYMTFEEYLDYWGRDIKRECKIESKIEDILEILGEQGENIPEDLRQQISSETNLEVLKKWHKEAARNNSIAEFRKVAGI